MKFSHWQELPANFLLLAVTGFALLELAGNWVLSDFGTPLAFLLIRLAELIFLLLLFFRFAVTGAIGLDRLPKWHDWRVFLMVSAFCLAVVLACFLFMPQLRSYVGVPTWLAPVQGLLLMTTVAPLVEEFFFRGVVYRMLRQLTGVVAAVLISALLFSLMHGAIAVPQLAGGLIFAIAYEWSRNLWIPILLHAGANGSVWLIATYLN